MNKILQLCPVDGCDWEFDPLLLPPPRIELPADTRLADVLDTAITASAVESARATEKILRDHLETHDVVDFVRTIHRLQQELAQFDGGVRPHVYAPTAYSMAESARPALPLSGVRRVAPEWARGKWDA